MIDEKKGTNLVMQLIKDGFVVKNDLLHTLQSEEVLTTPEKVRDEMEVWYKNMGIETLTGKPFRLTLPYFTEEEIKEVEANDEILLCLPSGIDAVTLGKMFHMDCWAFHDPLVTLNTEYADFWFSTKKSPEPDFLDRTPREISKQYKDDEKLNISIERYMVFLARMKYLTGEYPEKECKTWLPNTRYEGKGIVIAGIDSNSKFCAHGWMPNFHSPRVGGRYVYIVDHH